MGHDQLPLLPTPPRKLVQLETLHVHFHEHEHTPKIPSDKHSPGSLETSADNPDWPSANVAPIFKVGDRTDLSNYRTIYLTSIVSIIFEHIIHKHIMNLSGAVYYPPQS